MHGSFHFGKNPEANYGIGLEVLSTRMDNLAPLLEDRQRFLDDVRLYWSDKKKSVTVSANKTRNKTVANIIMSVARGR